jgi:hypothetical protein
MEIQTLKVMTVEEFWKQQNRRELDKHEKKFQLFDYWDMIDFAEQYADEHGEEKYNQGYEAGRKDVDELTEKADLNGYSRGIADKEQYAGEQSRETAVEYASFTWMLDDDDFTGKTPYEIFDKWKSNQKEQ